LMRPPPLTACQCRADKISGHAARSAIKPGSALSSNRAATLTASLTECRLLAEGVEQLDIGADFDVRYR
jgi:hypothetical protein